ncbi:hypothetical protein A3L12_08125 [Thermococcus sp. P6]|uniref:hypothetical protein n=1 Tax=Thermococcus sp. P6 TaxID=122420 RepID=UPI000B59CFE3|nr:hypothetical protein [Thermococcus sp. P6]ASJ11262.1 hypothetical protein A3L12_08125 [Thermococcus sp. P6]
MFKLWKVKEFRMDVLLTILIFVMLPFLGNMAQISAWVREKDDVLTSVSVTLLGFLITSLVILLTFPENHRIKFIKKHPTYPKIYDYFLFTIILLLILAIASLVVSLVPQLSALVVLLLVWSLISLLRCVWILKKMIELYFQ